MNAEYTDETLVYVNPATKKVVSIVSFTEKGTIKPMEWEYDEETPVKDEKGEKDSKPPKRRKKKGGKRFYPWCSYRTAKRVYHVEGKFKEEQPEENNFNSVLEKALKEAYWD